MRVQLFLLMLVCYITQSKIILGQNTFQKIIHAPVTSIHHSSYGEFMMFGENNGSLDAIKYNQWGNFQWAEQLSTSGGLSLFGSDRSSYRNLHFLSCTTGTNEPGFIIIDSTWKTKGISIQTQLSVAPLVFNENKNKEMYMVFSQDSNIWYSDAIILKTDSAFNPIWNILVDLPQLYGETHPTAATMTKSGCILLTGMIMNTLFLIKISPQGTLIWDKYFNPTYPITCTSIYPISIIESSTKDILISSDLFNLGYSQHSLIKFDSTGSPLFIKSLNKSTNNETSPECISEASNGDYMLKGYKNGTGDTNYVIRMNTSGNIIWQKEYLNYTEKMGFYSQRTLIEDQNGDLMLLHKNMSQEYFLTRTDGSGFISCNNQNATLFTSSVTLSPTTRPIQIFSHFLTTNNLVINHSIMNIEDSAMCMPTLSNDIDLHKDVIIYPNPATEKISFRTRFAISNLEIFDYEGRKITNHQPNTDQVLLEVKNYKNGMYFYVLNLDDKSQVTGKFIISK